MDDELFSAVCSKLGLVTVDDAQVNATWNAESGRQDFSNNVTLICRRIAISIYQKPEWKEALLSSNIAEITKKNTSLSDQSKLLSISMTSWLLPDAIHNHDDSEVQFVAQYANSMLAVLKQFADSRQDIMEEILSLALRDVGLQPANNELPAVVPVTPASVPGPLSTREPHLKTLPRTAPTVPFVSTVQKPGIKAQADANQVVVSNLSTPKQPATDTASTERTVSQWKDLPLPVDEPDLHSAWDQRSAAATKNMQIVGARVRGKKHKHEGTNCDDWFDFSTSGQWTILAVSDGAGSKKFSRVGAKAACTAAVRSLSAKLKNHFIESRTTWTAEAFQQADLLQVKHWLVTAMQEAWSAVVKAAADRADSPSHQQVLGRPLLVSDLSTTLLVAVHTTVVRDGAEVSLAFGCSVGDGMIAAIGKRGSTHTLMTADSGEHSGETRFLDEREIATEKLEQRVFPFLGSLKALLLMTDGVSDDYFPNDTGMSDLYGDLLLNGILPREATSIALLPQSTSIAPESYQTLSGRDVRGGWEQIVVRSIKSYAAAFGKTPLEVWTDPQWLANAMAGDPLCVSLAADERLRTWLDFYSVRGSFDDRTLVALFH